VYGFAVCIGGEVAVATLTPDTFLGRSLERPTLAGHSVPSLT
jgi:hypothetical protein